MFVLCKLMEEIYFQAEQYTHNLSLTVRDLIFKKYLFKITKLGPCVRIKSIEIIDNVLLRKEADLLLKVQLELVIVKLLSD